MHRSTPSIHGRHSRSVLSALLIGGSLIVATPTALTTPRVAASAATAPCIPAGHGPNAIPSIVFGRKGGNIRPMRVSIYGDGTISYEGGAPLSRSYTIHPDAVQGLQKLARAEGFDSWPTLIPSKHLFPDFANLFVTLRAGCSTATRTVTLQAGAASPTFTELFDTLLAATAQQY